MKLKYFLFYNLLESLEPNQLFYLFNAIKLLSHPNTLNLQINKDAKNTFLEWTKDNIDNLNEDEKWQIYVLIEVYNLIKNKKDEEVDLKALQSITDNVLMIILFINKYGRLAKNKNELKIIGKEIAIAEVT